MKRVPDVAICIYVFMGTGVYYGLGYSEGGISVGYWLNRTTEDPCCDIRITYPDVCKGQQYRITLMQVEDSYVIE